MEIQKKHRAKIIIGTVVVFVVLAVFFFRKIDFQQVGKTLSSLNPQYLALAFLFNALQVLFWILRPWPLVPKDKTLSFKVLAKAVSVGQFLNSFAPARAGDVAKVYILSSAKTENSLTPSNAIGLLATDKILDLLSIVCIAFFSGAMAFQSQESNSSSIALYVVGAIVLIGVIGFFVISEKIKAKIKVWIQEFLFGMRPLLSPKAALPSLAFAFCVWICEALAIQMVLYSANFPLEFTKCIYIMCIVNLGVMVPLSVANIGAFEAAFSYGVSKFGIGVSDALALAFAHHLLQAGAMTLWALCTFRLGGKLNLKTKVMKANEVGIQ